MTWCHAATKAHARRSGPSGPGIAAGSAIALAALLAVAMTLSSACAVAAAPPVDAVAVTPIAAPPGLLEPDVSTEALVRAIEAELGRMGVRVTGPGATGPVWEAVLDSIGGFYDTSTGEIDDARLAAARRALAARAAARFGTAAVLMPRLELAEAEWRGGKAEWDGVEEGIGSVPGGGVVPAFTLVVTVLGPDGSVRCEDRGGIQVLVKFGFTAKPKPVDREKLLRDPKRLGRAAALALECFAGAEGATP